MKNPLLAFLLGFFPGGGLLYLGVFLRGLAYLIGEFALIAFTFFMLSVGVGGEIILVVFAGVILYIINLVDTAIMASKLLKNKQDPSSKVGEELDYERFRTILLSFIPGVGHFHLGLMNRGITLLTASLGFCIMVLFVAFLTDRGEFMVFLLLFPVIWVYSFFDAIQQLNKKQKGEELVDRTLLEDIERGREEGRKSKGLATFLSIFPGAGHLYLGLQRRGIQLMAAFLFSIYILDVLRLGIFLFLIPIIWFYSFFDGLQKSSRYGEEELEDVPIVSYFENHQKWLGIGLVVVGLYYMTTNVLLPAFAPSIIEVLNIDVWYWFNRYFQTAIVCIVLIGGGLKLLSGTKEKKKMKKG
ncbi:hypothetical protein MKX67_03290 [Cytobacillus sp. FSL W7-1323]|uniref:Multi-TM2 domain-containing protein n=1 Tax=Cytobacillus kochii TaxID=859143 RepID=A0A248TG19_9BACI|nr:MULTISPECIES: hypothetical protein [Cytobacillus]ASV67079.1 hypothetical protein CKF48_06885 [Cytobacillus kochii]MDQ0185347.1 hypothetical protein [Cytobacillus kochii]MEA1854681.1 hypothetical protein [Cytobacillus sp. OWB-43]MED1606035.1 hypothetical protein [Cytobacillus kochii]